MRKVVWMLALALVVGLAAGAPAGAQDKPKEPDKTQAAASDPVTGEWEGLVDMPDGAMAFSMTLKLDKDKVTGEVAGPQGAAAISQGAWAEKEAKLTIAFTYVDGSPVSMSATVGPDQMTGTLDYGGGQMVTNWVAKRKPAK